MLPIIASDGEAATYFSSLCCLSVNVGLTAKRTSKSVHVNRVVKIKVVLLLWLH